MGSGKGAVDYWVVVIKPGNIIFELSDTIPLEIAKRALEVASQKLPIKTKILLPAESY
jgi:large subunit ribosomal protein L16